MTAPDPHTCGAAVDAAGFWVDDQGHRAFLRSDALRQLEFFEASLGETPGFQQLDMQGSQRPDDLQELHSTTRLVHCHALAEMIGLAGAGKMVEQGLAYLRDYHHDKVHGGYVWGLRGDQVADPRKLAYGHVFVLLAASTAKMAGHASADPLLSDVADVLAERFWEEEAGLFADEWSRDWSPFSTYRGMNANMHGVEALLAAYEATGQELFLHRAGRILDRFTVQIAPQEGWRLPEHYTENWQIDRAYSGDPMFRPAGTTPGHSLELGRLLLHYWDLTDRRDATAPKRARALIEQALTDAWMVGAKAEGYSIEGGLAYTLNFDGSIAMANRFWWPVTEAIGALATLIKLERRDEDEHWYRRLWQFASARFVDHENGGWIPEIDPSGKPKMTIFEGKPDLYHSFQACLFPLAKTPIAHIRSVQALGRDFLASPI
ncbi:AGE family epimerase/isomerase [Phaeobacter italicus]|uniref:AGE family epimerase/isomerase n=1 Tax=Phaeobacter italicus TaxID=481446 RepID=UPI00248F2D29|nr:AGE family epimerase/isomerase [Phaeobacter italicus]